MKLSDFELEVMQHFWDAEPRSAPEIHELVQNNRTAAYGTVKTIIDRLEAKGALLRFKQVGRTILYQPAVEKSIVSKKLVPDLIRYLFKGSPKNLITQLLVDEELAQDDIEHIKKLISQIESEKKGKQ
jgi:BlaI family penicillinase repressor